jgi:hypothetical protein
LRTPNITLADLFSWTILTELHLSELTLLLHRSFSESQQTQCELLNKW